MGRTTVGVSRNRTHFLAAAAAVAALAAVTSPAKAGGTLWFGNDGAGTEFHTDLNGNVIGTVKQSITGVAWTGSTLYMGDPGANIFAKNLDGTPKPGNFTTPVLGSPSEDMAWDSKRHDLVRVYHFALASGEIQVFNTSGGVINSAALMSVDPTGTLTTPMGALGVAYDSKRDQFDVSFCNNGCGAIGGVVEAYDASTLAYVGTLFTSTTSYLGGLGYDPATDTLWVGGDNANGVFVDHMTRDGTILSGFGGFGVFPDGMEFISSSVPEPSAWVLMLLGVAGLGLALRVRGTPVAA
jgi:hypothetical protein